MKEIHAEITLKNGIDVEKAAEGTMPETAVRQLTLDAVIDTGAWTLVLNEECRAALGFRKRRPDRVIMADGSTSTGYQVGPVEVCWKDRWALCSAVVLPDSPEVLIGGIPLEALDLIIDPNVGLIGAHGDQILHRMY